jgi:hypothetical protein
MLLMDRDTSLRSLDCGEADPGAMLGAEGEELTKCMAEGLRSGVALSAAPPAACGIGEAGEGLAS